MHYLPALCVENNNLNTQLEGFKKPGSFLQNPLQYVSQKKPSGLNWNYKLFLKCINFLTNPELDLKQDSEELTTHIFNLSNSILKHFKILLQRIG